MEARSRMLPLARQALPLHAIIRNFKILVNQIDLNQEPQNRQALAQKVKTLSEEKLQYYRSSRFGFIKEFFSALRNYFLLNTFASSGQLGLNLANDFLAQQKAIDPLPVVLKQPEKVNKDQIEAVILDEFEPELPLNLKVEKLQPQPQPFQTPKQKMLETLSNIWQYPNYEVKNGIKNICSVIFLEAEIVKWEKNDQTQEYHLELSHELTGTHPKLPGKVVIKKEMKIQFVEEPAVGEGKHKQIIAFPDGGIVQKIETQLLGFSMGTDIGLNRISVEEENQQIMCSIEFKLGSFRLPIQEGHHFWSTVNWDPLL